MMTMSYLNLNLNLNMAASRHILGCRLHNLIYKPRLSLSTKCCSTQIIKVSAIVVEPIVVEGRNVCPALESFVIGEYICSQCKRLEKSALIWWIKWLLFKGYLQSQWKYFSQQSENIYLVCEFSLTKKPPHPMYNALLCTSLICW